ncbi:UvrD-like helicase C-terminal domain-containing protein [Dyella sp. OK004]|uniref:ATP-dependent DNA helicase n=1 Tax=Dyella sp. OK004 TaxID=1855292 RepID=UPI0008ED3366|nr:ATP-dependent RecD-like DNA helicase [Dyella sp. OK004]SFS13766.1 UvrD-like helicase C-terminal domain-containing protein [Dyella sp. OK004]
MALVAEQIRSANAAICQNIDALGEQRPLLSQNVLAQLRNLVEGVLVRLHLGTGDAEFGYDAVKPALAYVRSQGKLNFLSRFHSLLQVSSSHYTLDGDASERLMLKYCEYMYRLRSLVRTACAMDVLGNLELFPIDLDPSLREYHLKIARRIEAVRGTKLDREAGARYYIHRIRPFFVEGHIYYEVTFYRAVNRVSKFDRAIAFTDIDMTDKYSAYLVLQRDAIRVLDQTMPITLIRAWDVSIRPCELDNFARLLGIRTKVRSSSAEFHYLMQGLTATSGSLLDLMDMEEKDYRSARFVPKAGDAPIIFSILDEARRIIRSRANGYNLIRYLMLRMHNHVLKSQYAADPCRWLSNLRLQLGCIPFEKMPFCTSPRDHNPRFSDLIEALDAGQRRHELLARRLQINVEQHGMLYTPVEDLEAFGDPKALIAAFNGNLYHKHGHRTLEQDKDHVFIRGYEDETAAIVSTLQAAAADGIAGYTQAVARWLEHTLREIDDPAKKDALERLFSDSKVALIYGAAGTGKSTMVDHIANYFNDKSKLFLAHTNPAVDNLKRKVNTQNATFRTISSHIYRTGFDPEYDLLIIDECSTVGNSDLLKVLQKTSFKLLVLVGDVYQIESIQFGNWFSIIRAFLADSAIFELTTPFRTKSPALLLFWNKVRNIDDDIDEVIAKNGYSGVLDKTLFEHVGDDEIILCLNYDGLYGINNVNRFLQSSNPNPAILWREATYKVGDPILFNESERFRSVLYNNLKGHIVAIEQGQGSLRFDVEVDRSLSAFDVVGTELEWVAGSTVRFTVVDQDTSDDDDDALYTVVPFQVAYAVSIHKAQGLEYDAVKIVVTNANEEDLTHSIFYTAITRARQHLRIFWTPETQRKVLANLRRTINPKDVALLAARRGFTPAR